MPAEQGGTGSGPESIAIAARTGAPLSLQTASNPLASLHKGYDAEHARMEAWMDENPEFIQDYFIRKATRQVVDAWLVSHATSAGNDVIGSPTHSNGQNCSSRGGSGATTPVRKISAHEFERGGLLKPIVNTIDGTPTFLSIGTGGDCLSNSSGSSAATAAGNSSQYHHNHNHHGGNHHHHHHHHHHHQTANGQCGNLNCHHRPQRLSRHELKQLDEKELIFELVKDICNELDIRSLCHKILQNVSILLNADRGSLFLVQGRCNGSDGPKKCLVSKLFDVCPRSTVEEMEQQEEVRVAWGTGIAGHVAESGEPVNIPDAYQDERFNGEIDSLTGYHTKALLCMPIKDSSGDVIGVAQVINKLNGECFSETDEKIFRSYLQFCGIGLRNAQLYEKSQLEIKRNQVLLDLARMIFEEQSTIEHMVFRILTHMQSLIQCQRVQILLVHEASKGSFSRVFDFEANDLSQDEPIARSSPFESRFPINVGITGHAATTGETINIANAYDDDRFDPSVDENPAFGFRHKSILCMAIKNSLGQIIGVIQLVNKFDDLAFTKNDENFVEAFAIFCGMGIHNTHMYEKAIVAMAKQSVTLEVLSYHASATFEEAHRLRRLRVPSAAHFRLHDFKFDDITFDDDDTLKACLRMFLDLDFVERFHIDYEVLCRWLLSVKKNYRNVTYHNWRHAFNVAQMMFAILTATQWWKIFGEIECLALVIACLCHDLDHRGTNNSFQIKASSPLAQLYSTSTMEHHHFDQCVMILNSPGNQILANLSSDDYCRVIRVLEDAILSTDLAVYFRKRGPFLQSVREQPLTYWLADEPRALLRAMSMTVCDLSAITKPWDIEKRVADLVSSEFFEQGDMEKHELNITPIDIMNREKEDELPMMQVGFIDSICLPIYEAFAHLSEKLDPLVEGVCRNRQNWIDLSSKATPKTREEATLNEIVASNDGICIKCSEQLAITDDDATAVIINGSKSDADDCDAPLHTNDDDDGDDDDGDDVKKDDLDEDEGDDGDEENDEPDRDSNDVDTNDGVSNVCCRSLSTAPSAKDAGSLATSTENMVIATTMADANRIASNLSNLNRQRPQKLCAHRCCDRACSTNLRKASSLKGPQDLLCRRTVTACGCSAPMMSAAASDGTIANSDVSGNIMICCRQQHQRQQQQQQEDQHQYQFCCCHQRCYHHHHHHQHHQHHRHHHHNHNHSQNHSQCHGHGNNNNSPTATSNAGDCDKIPKIVGKLDNIDTCLQHLRQPNGIVGGGGFVTNGHLGHQASNILLRRHSETNGTLVTTLPSPVATMKGDNMTTTTTTTSSSSSSSPSSPATSNGDN